MSTDFIEEFASLKSRKVSLYFQFLSEIRTKKLSEPKFVVIYGNVDILIASGPHISKSVPASGELL
jgi:hypothetical protein